MERRVFKETPFPAWKLIYAVVCVGLIASMWTKHILLAVPMVIVLLLITDRLIRGEYVLESEVLIMRRGRFLKEKPLLISSIKFVYVFHGMAAFGGSVALVLDKGSIYLNPENTESFIKTLCQRNANIQVIEK